MTELASQSQLRAGLWRWALVLVPGLVLLALLVTAFSGSTSNNPWFLALTKPALYPPPALFGIVWTSLYALMGLALAIIITARGAWGREHAVIAFVIQLVLNLAWSPLFFAAHQITWALLLLVALDVAVLVTVWLFWRVRPVAGILLLPYFAWVLFATLLNYQFMVANPKLDGQNAAPTTQRIAI
jgi:translocator protein